MSAAANKVSPAEYAQVPHYDGIRVNAAIPVGAVEAWKRETIQKIIACSSLPQNWDSHGSRAPGRAVVQTAIELVREIPVPTLPVPRVVPVSGGGYHLEWSVADRELEISIDARCRIEALRVEDGVPSEAEAVADVPALFGWLTH
jgi:hypothetical protein